MELGLLFIVGKVSQQPWAVKGWLLPVGVFFGLMVFVDAFLPDKMVGRLALEDLSKTWAGLFLLAYAWHYTINSIPYSEPKESDGN